MEVSGAPEISVVIPCLNVASTLGAQLEGLAGQRTLVPWEVVVVDNGSVDNSVAIAESFANRLRLRVIRCETPGLSAARNAGVRAAKASVVAFCDGDDVVAEGWVDAMARGLRDHECVTGPLELDRLNRPQLAASRGRKGASGVPTFGRTFPYPRGGNMGIRRSTLERLGWFDERTPALEDQELGLRMYVAGVEVHYEPDATVHYRYSSDVASIWRQGLRYGRARVATFVVVKQAGVATPSRVGGWRSWMWLVVHAPRVRSHDGRLALLWVLASRLGHLSGSLRWRTVFV